MIEFHQATFRYASDLILNDFDLLVPEGQIVCLLGESGCGKSTALRLAAGLETPFSGAVTVGERPAVVFQDAALMPWATVEENVALPLSARGKGGLDAVGAALDRVGLGGFQKRYPKTLSGGQKMRTAIARALVEDRPLILMDEPFAALDEFRRLGLNDLLLDLREQRNLTILFVTHSLFEAAYLADIIAVMRGGRVLETLETGWEKEARGQDRRGSQRFTDLLARAEALLAAEPGLEGRCGSASA